MPFYQDSASITNGIAGRITKFNTSLEITSLSPSGLTNLTDGASGVVDNTLQGLPDPTDGLLTTDALRDEIVVNLLPPLRNNLTDIVNKINQISNILKQHNLLS